ncbi:MAG: hypothetical protein QXJ74_07740 [Nitrososphaera sp.]|nr:hypothetical protein [Nitrososphaera sp.]NWG38089.1 hypothetical protein [Nitrososphaera sp.]
MSDSSDNEKGWVELAYEDRIRHTPKTGYDLVGVDDFEEPGEQLCP